MISDADGADRRGFIILISLRFYSAFFCFWGMVKVGIAVATNAFGAFLCHRGFERTSADTTRSEVKTYYYFGVDDVGVVCCVRLVTEEIRVNPPYPPRVLIRFIIHRGSGVVFADGEVA